MYRKENKKRKASKHRIIVLCEGKTEKLYLDGLKKSLTRQLQRDIDINITKAKESEPVKAIKELKSKITKAKHEKQPYSEKWLVFDDDNRDLVEVFQQLKKAKINYVYNSIALEFWFLIHFTETNKRYPSAASAIADLKKHIGKYSKTDTGIWEKLVPNYEKAKRQAVKMRKQYKKEGTKIYDCKPYSNMDELIEQIKTLPYD